LDEAKTKDKTGTKANNQYTNQMHQSKWQIHY